MNNAALLVDFNPLDDTFSVAKIDWDEVLTVL